MDTSVNQTVTTAYIHVYAVDAGFEKVEALPGLG